MTEEHAELRLVPRLDYRGGKQILCPECDWRLPIDEMTECSNCGAHLQLELKVLAPGVDEAT